MKLYNDYNSYLKAKYGCKVYRIGLDAGFTCPNRDGTKGTSGCVYCNEDGSRSSYAEAKDSIGTQLEKRIAFLKKTRNAPKFIAYFQAFTNTYAPPETLKKAYDEILPFKDIVGVSIGTRPDAIDEEKLGLIASYRKRYEVWVEYGLQSVHDKTLDLIGRGHHFADFLKAVKMTKGFGILIGAHVILGLPGESGPDMMRTAEAVSGLKIDGIKIHLLHILKGSALEPLYREGRIKVLEQNKYVELVCYFLERLSPDIVIQRLTGEGERGKHVAPAWALDKMGTLRKIEETLIKRGTRQGSRFVLPTTNSQLQTTNYKLPVKSSSRP